jgi:hypothetical protein
LQNQRLESNGSRLKSIGHLWLWPLGLFHAQAPTGDKLISLDLINRHAEVKSAKGETRTIEFDYESQGPPIMGVATAPNSTICGGTTFPKPTKSKCWPNPPPPFHQAAHA